MSRKPRDRRHDNPGRPATGDAEVEHKVRVSAEVDAALRASASIQGLTLSEWWRWAARHALGMG